MRKFILSAAVIGSALIAAAPASAQYNQSYDNGYNPYQQGYQNDGYNQYNNQYDRSNQYDRYNQYNQYNQGYGNAGRWTQELRQLSNDVERLSRQGWLDRREVQQMRYNISNVDNALRTYSRRGRGIDRREAYEMDRRIRNLQISIRNSANDADTRNRDNRYRR